MQPKLEVNPILDNMYHDIQKIADYEPEFLQSFAQAVKHFASTYGDKYEAGSSTIVTKNDLYEPLHGKSINLYQCKRYLQRYDTAGFIKSENPVDLVKAIHFLLFELVRKNRVIGLSETKAIFAPDATN